MPSDCNDVSCFQEISKKELEIIFHLSVSFSTLLTAYWLAMFVSTESSRTVLLIDRSEPRFDGRTGGKIRITLKNNKNIDIFC